MAESKNNEPKGGKDPLLDKLERLEADILEIDRVRHQQTMIVRVGLILVILAIALFGWNLYKFSVKITSEENMNEFVRTIGSDMVTMFENDQNLKDMKTKMLEEVIPNLSKQIVDRLMKEAPAFKAKGEMLMTNVKEHLETSIRTTLADELEKSVKELEGEIKKQYPNLSAENIEAVFKESETIFLEHITTMLEKKVEIVYSDLDDMEKTLAKFGKIADEKNLSQKERSDVQLDFIENLLELGIYQVNPEKGELPAEVAQGGVK